MGAEGLATHALAGVDEAVASGIDVGVVYLRRIANKNEL
jgi:hypothetical protein